MKAVAAAVVLVALASVPDTAQAQGNYQQVVRNQLTSMGTVLLQRGYTAMGEPTTGSLRDDASSSHMVALVGGARYVIVGACDQDCTDVDLKVFGPDGTELDSDLETDDRPVLEFVAPATGQFRVEVLMPTCSTSPCFWGFQVYASGGK